MTDVSKIQGPSGSPQGAGKKEAAIDADKFKEEMNKRITEVSAVDPDEQKKRKQAEEENEDLNAPQPGPTTPASQVTPFSMEQETKETSPFAMQSGGAGTSPMDSAKLTQQPSVPKTAFFQAPAQEETEDDSGSMEQPQLGASAPAAAAPEAAFTSQQQTTEAQQAQQQAQTQDQQAQQQAQQAGQQAQPQPGWTPEGEQPVAPGPPESAQQQTGGQGGAPASGQPDEQESGAGGNKGGGMYGPPGGMTAADLEGTEPSQTQDTSTFFEQLGKDQGGGKKGKKGPETPEELEEAAEALGAVPGASPPAPFTQSVEGSAEKKVEEKEKAAGAETTGLPMTIDQALAQTPAAPGVETLPSYANINPQVQELFDRMVGVMTVMQSSGVTETTITLNSPQFASSVFFGTQIIIQEYSTAPQAYNIQINGTPQAVALFQGNADDLMAAFQSGNYNFRVNRLETGYLTDRPLFKRKGKVSGDKDQKGDTP